MEKDTLYCRIKSGLQRYRILKGGLKERRSFCLESGYCSGVPFKSRTNINSQEMNHHSKIIKNRPLIILILFWLLALGIVSRVIYLSVFEQDFLREEGEKRFLRLESLPAYRGIIADRNGRPIAVSTPVTSIWIEPQVLLAQEKQLSILAKKLSIPLDNLRGKIKKNKNRSFVYLRRHLPPAIAEKILSLNIRGVHGQREYRRYYPASEVTAHLVGFTDIDGRGQEGIELAYDHVLRGVSGKQRVIKDRKGHIVGDLGNVEMAQSGQDLKLSIDLRMQFIAHRALMSAMAKYKASSGSIVVLDVNTFEVLSMVNYPIYNPNNRKKLKWNHLRNRAVTDVFEPGSTIKPFTVAAALESGKFNHSTPINTSPGYFVVGGKLIQDSRNYGLIDVTTVLSKSSNVGASKIALSLSASQLTSVFSRLGLGQYEGVGFPGEQTGYLPRRDRWSPIEVATLSYGYGLSTTALQLVGAYSTLANQGIQLPVSLLKTEIVNEQEERILSIPIVKELTTMLETVISPEGTAWKAHIPGYRVAGKTGTVHKLTKYGYAKDKYLSLFVGFAPVSKPEFAMIVAVDDPKGKAYYGGQVAAPVFSNVMNDILRVRGVAPDQYNVKSSANRVAEAEQVEGLFDNG